MARVSASLLAAFVVCAATPLAGDIVVFKDGQCEETTIVQVGNDAITVQGPYGDLTYPLTAVYWYCPSDPQRPGLEYYWAGVRLLELHKKHTAIEMFGKAGESDPRYAAAGRNAVSNYEPQDTRSAMARLRPDEEVTSASSSQCPVYRVPCKLCGGTGSIEYKAPKIGQTDNLHPYIMQAA
jgi:hypothetical protein